MRKTEGTSIVKQESTSTCHAVSISYAAAYESPGRCIGKTFIPYEGSLNFRAFRSATLLTFGVNRSPVLVSIHKVSFLHGIQEHPLDPMCGILYVPPAGWLDPRSRLWRSCHSIEEKLPFFIITTTPIKRKKASTIGFVLSRMIILWFLLCFQMLI